MNENAAANLFDRKVLSRIITNKFSKQKAACISPLTEPKKPNGRPPQGFEPGQALCGTRIGIEFRGEEKSQVEPTKMKKAKKSFVYRKKFDKLSINDRKMSLKKNVNKENSQQKKSKIIYL